MENYINEYKYTCKIELDGDFDKVLNVYFDRSIMMEWNEGLEKIENISENEFNLFYDFGDSTVKMEASLLEFNPPHYAKSVYQVPGVWNQCIDHFEKLDNKILWTMEVVFRFLEDPQVSIDAFTKKTYSGMKIFKNYFENL